MARVVRGGEDRVGEVEAREERLGVARGRAREPGPRRERQAVERRERPRGLLAALPSLSSLLGQEHLREERGPVAVVGRHLVREVERVVREEDLPGAAVALRFLSVASLRQEAATAAAHVVPGVLAAGASASAVLHRGHIVPGVLIRSSSLVAGMAVRRHGVHHEGAPGGHVAADAHLH